MRRASGRFCPHAKVIHVDIDPAELNKIKAAHVGIVADVGDTLKSLLPRVHEQRRPEWIGHVDSLRAAHPLQKPGVDDPRTPYGLIQHVADLLDDDAIITTDVGQHQMWTAQAYPFRQPRTWLTSGGLGTMGFGLPAAIGAALAAPDATVVCISGDGSLLMNIQELVTAVEEQVNVKVIVMNNNSLDWSASNERDCSTTSGCSPAISSAVSISLRSWAASGWPPSTWPRTTTRVVRWTKPSADPAPA